MLGDVVTACKLLIGQRMLVDDDRIHGGAKVGPGRDGGGDGLVRQVDVLVHGQIGHVNAKLMIVDDVAAVRIVAAYLPHARHVTCGDRGNLPVPPSRDVVKRTSKAGVRDTILEAVEADDVAFLIPDKVVLPRGRVVVELQVAWNVQPADRRGVVGIAEGVKTPVAHPPLGNSVAIHIVHPKDLLRALVSLDDCGGGHGEVIASLLEVREVLDALAAIVEAIVGAEGVLALHIALIILDPFAVHEALVVDDGVERGRDDVLGPVFQLLGGAGFAPEAELVNGHAVNLANSGIFALFAEINVVLYRERGDNRKLVTIESEGSCS